MKKEVMKYLIVISILLIQSYTLFSQWKRCGCSHSDNVNKFSKYGASIFAGVQNGLLKSTDNGISWEFFNRERVNQPVRFITKIADTIYFCSGENMFVTTDKGGDIDIHKHFYETSMIASKNDTLIIYYGGRFVLYIPKTGESIVNTGPPPGNAYKSILIRENSIFLTSETKGIFRSDDGGNSWTEVNEGMTRKSIRGIEYGTSQLFALNSFGELFRSADNAAHWTKINTLGKATIYSVSCTNSGLYCATSEGLQFSSDNGEAWLKLSFPGIEYGHITNIWENDGILFAGMNALGIYRSTNKGEVWLKTGKSCRAFYDMNVVDNTIYSFESYTYYTDNYSEFWTLSKNGGKVYGSEDVLFRLSGGSESSLYRSYDKGENWTLLIDSKKVKYLTEVVYHKGILYATHDKGIMVSKDNGDIWSDSTPVDTSITTITASEDKVFIQFKNGEVYYTDNDAQSWNKLETPIGKKYFQFITLNGGIFASTEVDLQRTTDVGITWQSVGFTKRRVKGIITVGNSLVYGMNGRVITTDLTGEMQYGWGDLKEEIHDIVRVGDTLFASTSLGMWRANVKSMPTTVNEDSQTVSNINIYPNPTTNTITVQTQTDTPYSYLIINQLGETVQSGKVEENSFSHQISVNTLLSGTYIFISQRSGIITKQIFSVIK